MRTKEEQRHSKSPLTHRMTTPDPAEVPLARDDLDFAIKAAIEACDGDARAAIRSLLVANDFLIEHNVAARPRTGLGVASDLARLHALDQHAPDEQRRSRIADLSDGRQTSAGAACTIRAPQRVRR